MKDQEEEWLEVYREASEEQDSEKLFQLVRRINELLDAKDRRLRQTRIELTSNRKIVFQIAYDEMLLIKRAELLKNRGYEVSPVLGNESLTHSREAGTASALHRGTCGHREKPEKKWSGG